MITKSVFLMLIYNYFMRIFILIGTNMSKKYNLFDSLYIFYLSSFIFYGIQVIWEKHNNWTILQGGQRSWSFGKVREFCGTWKKSGKSEGISWNSGKTGNFNTKLGKVREFYLREINIASFFKIHSSGQQEFVTHAHGFLSKNKN